ncbi:tetratricopeptide repeat protein [Desulfonatronovibrio hydrogenovorans]|uniref:tetratricopeptide repeat protein n=1 Tax=Desulfonatronovibrio hydrogenovorans TaxID=53245 RepID=UPI00048B42CD|nr:tetratricopeptide repeat protein [Desulfonatronovibrio hydrogenovorans]
MNYHFIILFFSLLLFFPSQALALDPGNRDSYHEWLKRYGAMDIYAMNLREQDPSPQARLDYANALVSLGNAQEALTVLNSLETMDSPQVQGKSHWIRHRALRQLGEFERSILSVVEAAGLLGFQETVQLMSQEPDLEKLWNNVWKRWYFQTLRPDMVHEGRILIMDLSFRLASAAWPDQGFWSKISSPLAATPAEKTGPSSDQIQIAKALSLWSIGHWSMADQALEQVSNSSKKSFFRELGTFLRSSDLAAWKSNDSSIKSSGFSQVYAQQLINFVLEDFRLKSPEAGSWEPFLTQVKTFPPGRSLEVIRQELSSALLSGDVRSRLHALEFIFELQEKNHVQALESWYKSGTDPSGLPFTIILAVSILSKDPGSLSSLPSSTYPVLKELLNAAGFNPDPEHMAGFWKEEIKNLSSLYTVFPLDYAVNYLFYQKNFTAKQDRESAINLAFLFPYSEIGQSSYLNLARHAYKDGNKTLAWRYLQNISQEFAQGPRQLELLEAKAGILMDMGREEESLSTYQEILKIDPARLNPETRLKLALLAQEKNQWDTAQAMLQDLWRDRSNISESIQAEILFWLGEGAQYRGDLEKALDYYLRLAWGFPGENIWAVTAMYRAGLIYEQRGMLDPAKNLFQTVLRNADRNAQKEAARQRIDAIESRMGASTGGGAYLF